MLKTLKFLVEYLGARCSGRFVSYDTQQNRREKRAREMVSNLSPASRTRFPEPILAQLLDAGWSEGRQWDSLDMQTFTARFSLPFAPVPRAILSEFGGLDIGFRGRTVLFGYIDERLCLSHALLPSLLGDMLYPLGRTNIFEDDGLGVLTDAAGHIYVDGATGYEAPRDYRLDLVAADIDSFLVRAFSGQITPEPQSWYYSLAEIA
jgi:hypothetical protein